LLANRGQSKVRKGELVPTELQIAGGSQTGQPRRNARISFHDGDRVTIIASKLGLPQHPAWFHNLRVHPDVKFGGQRFHAEVIDDGSERARLWQLADQVFPPYVSYRKRAAHAGRTIPIVQLTPP